MIVSDATVPIKTFLQKGIVGRPDNTARHYLRFVLNSHERRYIAFQPTGYLIIFNRSNHQIRGGRNRKSDGVIVIGQATDNLPGGKNSVIGISNQHHGIGSIRSQLLFPYGNMQTTIIFYKTC